MPNTVLNADFIIVWTSDDIGIICMHGNGTLKGWLTLAEVRLKYHVTLVWGKDKIVEVIMKSILSKTKKWVKYDKEGHLYWISKENSGNLWCFGINSNNFGRNKFLLRSRIKISNRDMSSYLFCSASKIHYFSHFSARMVKTSMNNQKWRREHKRNKQTNDPLT